jgi:2-hydroxycyclohexanecarboxyl-CoA dehydrogenase
VVNIGSDAGRIGEFREAVYAGCKGAQIAMTKAIAREVGKHNITLNVVCPGLTLPKDPEEFGALSGHSGSVGFDFKAVEEQAKKAYALRRLGTGQDIANAVAFLASEAANFITGQTLSVSGGYSMC